MSNKTEIRCLVFEEEDPGLYAYITGLPISRPRKRAAILSLLKTGLGSLHSRQLYAPAGTYPQPLSPVRPQEQGMRPPANEGGGAIFPEIIDAEDLIMIFQK
jgi:hypothetical protein